MKSIQDKDNKGHNITFSKEMGSICRMKLEIGGSIYLEILRVLHVLQKV